MELPPSVIPIHCAHRLVRTDEIKPNPANPNRHPSRQVTLYSEVIRANGWRRPITISNRSGLIVRGEGAWLAARHLALEFVPVEGQDYATEADELADLLADNRLADFSSTDSDALKTVLAQLAADAPGAVTGYSAEDLSALIDEIAPPAQFPITARLNERHDYVVIVVESETDWEFLKNLVGVRTEHSYKNSTVGEGRVIPFDRFLAALRTNRASLGADTEPAAAPLST